MLSMKKNTLINSTFFEKFNNKLLLKGKKKKYLGFIFDCWKNLKKSKIKPKYFFFLILEKIKPIFFFSKILKKRKKKKTVHYKPFLLSIKQRYIVSLKWLILPLKEKSKQKFFLNLEKCFLIFLNSSKKNLAILQKKKTYLIVLKYKHFIKI